jgi:hypothetical protein
VGVEGLQPHTWQEEDSMTNTTWRVTLHLVGGSTVELLSSTEPVRLDDGEIQAIWIDTRGSHVGHINWNAVAVVTWKQARPSGTA